MMFKLGCNTNEIADHFGCTTATVHLKLKQDGLAVRQIKGMSVYDIFSALDETSRNAFLHYAAFGERAGEPLAETLAGLFREYCISNANTNIISYPDEAPVFTPEELQAWVNEEEEEEDVVEEEEEEEVVEQPKKSTRGRKRNVFEEDDE